MKKVNTVSGEGTLIKFTMDTASKITPGIDFIENAYQQSVLKVDAKTIQERRMFKWKFPLQILKKNPKRLQLILKRKESDPDSLISYAKQSLMRAFDGMKELNDFTFSVKVPEGLHPKRFDSVFLWIQ